MILNIILTIENDEQRTAVENIYMNLYGRMITISNGILHNRQDAEDSVMDTFVKIADNAEKFTKISRNEMICLVVIYTKNSALNFYKRRNIRNTVSMTVYPDEDSYESEQMDIADETEDIQRMVINKETVELTRKAIDQLLPEQRDAVMLRYYHGYRDNEIAEVLEISENAVRVRLFRARTKLKTILGDDVYERCAF